MEGFESIHVHVHVYCINAHARYEQNNKERVTGSDNKDRALRTISTCANHNECSKQAS